MTRLMVLILAALLATNVGARSSDDEPKDRDKDRHNQDRHPDKIIRPLIPGTSAPDYGAPAVIIKDGKVYDLIPGTHTPNYGSGRYIIQER